MSKVLRMGDRIKIKVGKVEFVIAPLNQFHKIEVAECTKITRSGEEIFDLIRAQTLLVRYGLKEVNGITDVSGDAYKLEFEGDALTDDCVSEVFTIKEKAQYVTAAFQCLNELPDKLINPLNGEKLEGVELEVFGNEGKWLPVEVPPIP